MELTFAAERLADCWDEMQPLFAEHGREAGCFPDAPPRPARDRYAALEAAGALRLYTARNAAGHLVGYAAFIVTTDPHAADTVVAHQDVLYLTPACRRGRAGLRLIAWVDAQLHAAGVQEVRQDVPVTRDWSPLLRRAGYREYARLFCRRLDIHG